MRVLVIGSNGFVGRSIALHACALGCDVFGMGRTQLSSSAGTTYVQGDRTHPDQVRQIAVDRMIDVVVDVIPMLAADTQPLLHALDGQIRQYVMISSCDVYANYELLHRRTTGTATLTAVNEDSPLRSTAYPYRYDEPRTKEDPDQYLDDYDKIPIEIAVQQLASAWTILRLPMIYGPGDKQRRFRWAIAPMLRNHETLTIPRTWANWQSTYGYIENVGAAVAATLGNPSAYIQIFNVAEETSISQLGWAKKLAAACVWQGTIELTDDPRDSFHKRISNLDLSVPLKIDGSRHRELLSFSDVVDENTALQQTIASETLN